MAYLEVLQGGKLRLNTVFFSSLLGLVATTSAHGAKSASKSDWSVLAEREVVIIPDCDAAGRQYAEDVARILYGLGTPVAVKAISLPGLSEGQDIEQFVQSCVAAGKSLDEIRQEIEKLTDEATTISAVTAPGSVAASLSPDDLLEWEDFPLEVLPEPVRRFVNEYASAMDCNPINLVLPVLSMLGACIGTTRAVELKRSWREFPVIWSCVIARSGSLKSPAYAAAIQPLLDLQDEAFKQYDQEHEAYRRDKAAHDREFQRWKSSKAGGDPPEQPELPKCCRYFLSDATVESLAPILEDNPRGVLLARDELSGWVGSFNQYKTGRGGDEANWLEMHRAGTIMVDRKSTEKKVLYVRRAGVSITGTIQPGILRKAFSEEHFESGLVARLLLAWPPDRVKSWTNAAPDIAVDQSVQFLVRQLLGLEHEPGGNHDPVVLALSEDALHRWVDFYNDHAERIADAPDDELAAAFAKIEAYAPRLALIFQLVRGPDANEVDADSMECGIQAAKWFRSEAERVYGSLNDERGRQKGLDVVEFIRRRGASPPGTGTAGAGPLGAALLRTQRRAACAGVCLGGRYSGDRRQCDTTEAVPDGWRRNHSR